MVEVGQEKLMLAGKPKKYNVETQVKTNYNNL